MCIGTAGSADSTGTRIAFNLCPHVEPPAGSHAHDRHSYAGHGAAGAFDAPHQARARSLAASIQAS